LSVNVHLEPKLFGCRVIFSLVCESKVGLLMRQLIKSHKWFLIWNGLIVTPALFLFFNVSINCL